ncbi:MAG: hypothetical protein RL722_2772, partial [Pseudomonadota bacterium]
MMSPTHLPDLPAPAAALDASMGWIDSHCHLDAPEFEPDRSAVLERARAAGVGLQVLPAVTLESGRA